MKHLVLIPFYHLRDRTSLTVIFFIIAAFLWELQSFYILQIYQTALKAGVYYEQNQWIEIKFVAAV